jgi:hypothetical protein
MNHKNLYLEIGNRKKKLESKINDELLPLQRKMNDLLKQNKFAEYIEAEAQIAPIRDRIASEYDDLLMLRDRLYIKTGS